MRADDLSFEPDHFDAQIITRLPGYCTTVTMIRESVDREVRRIRKPRVIVAPPTREIPD